MVSYVCTFFGGSWGGETHTLVRTSNFIEEGSVVALSGDLYEASRLRAEDAGQVRCTMTYRGPVPDPPSEPQNPQGASPTPDRNAGLPTDLGTRPGLVEESTAQPAATSESDRDARPSHALTISVPADTAPALLFNAGRLAALRGWNDVEVISVAGIESQTPGGAPLVVVVAAAAFTVDHARGLAALHGVGREVLVVTDGEPNPAAVAWLPAATIVSDQ